MMVQLGQVLNLRIEIIRIRATRLLDRRFSFTLHTNLRKSHFCITVRTTVSRYQKLLELPEIFRSVWKLHSYRKREKRQSVPSRATRLRLLSLSNLGGNRESHESGSSRGMMLSFTRPRLPPAAVGTISYSKVCRRVTLRSFRESPLLAEERRTLTAARDEEMPLRRLTYYGVRIERTILYHPQYGEGDRFTFSKS